MLRSLKAYEEVKNSEWLIVEMLLRKLNKETQTFLFTNLQTRLPSFESFDESLKILIDLLESSKASNAKVDHTEKVANNY